MEFQNEFTVNLHCEFVGLDEFTADLAYDHFYVATLFEWFFVPNKIDAL